jgi:hypothetical protein
MKNLRFSQGLGGHWHGEPWTVLGCAGLLVFLAACASKKPTDDYLPLSNGFSWEYRLEVQMPAKTGGPQVFSGRQVNRVDGTEAIDGKTYFKVLYLYSGVPGFKDSPSFFRKAADGIYRINLIEGTSGKQPESLFLALPPTVGKTWTNQNSSVGTDVCRIEGFETVQLLSGEYPDCLKVSVENLDAQGKSRSKAAVYFAKGVGGVKVSAKFGESVLATSLEKYQLK